jgi:hypothetical protein
VFAYQEEDGTEETSLGELLQNPRALSILAKHGLPCLSCPAISFEMGSLRLSSGKLYGPDVKAVIKELNEAFQESEARP